jgi:hypothetical protein
MFKVGDIVRLKLYPKDEVANYGIIFEIRPKTKYPWNVKIMFFDNNWGAYADHDLIKVSK